VSSRTIQLTRTGAAQSALVGTSSAGFSITTGTSSASVVTAPQPALMLAFGDAAGAPFTFIQSPPPARSEPRPAPAPELPAPPVTVAEPDEPPPAGVLAAETSPEPADLAPAADTDTHLRADDPPETRAGNRPVPVTTPIELIIDSLTGHSLIEPIPVVIESLGDMVFTASVRNLNIQATGNSIGEALLILKEQIEITYDDLTKRPHRDADQKTALQLLQTYIAPSLASKPKKWF
jgi:hypothetical protein